MAILIGQPINRIDGPLKVSGRATYAAEHWDVGQPLYGFIVGATIGKGRITAIDAARAERAPGVRMVMTHRNAPAQGKADPSIRSAYSRAFPTLDGPDVHHYGEPVALDREIPLPTWHPLPGEKTGRHRPLPSCWCSAPRTAPPLACSRRRARFLHRRACK